MKAKILLAAILTAGFIAITYGQEEKSGELQTLFGNKDNKIDNGGYAAISMGYTQIDGVDVMTIGGRAGWLIDHHITLGFAGTGLVSTIYIDGYWPADQYYNEGYYLVGGYGGFFVEPIIAPNFPVHLSFPIMIGGGGLALNESTWHDYDNDYNYDNYEPFDWDSYFVCEPGMEIELNLVKFFRVAFGVSYRYTSDLHMQYVPKDMMRGFNGNVTLKFGKF